MSSSPVQTAHSILTYPRPPAAGAIYSWLEDWKAGVLAAGGADTVQDLVDAYAAQHPTNLDRRNRQSVAVHLMSLCAAAESGLDGAQRRARMSCWTHREYPSLQPAPSRFAVTVPDVVDASLHQRPETVGGMAAETWMAWSEHHDAVRGWLASSWS